MNRLVSSSSKLKWREKSDNAYEITLDGLTLIPTLRDVKLFCAAEDMYYTLEHIRTICESSDKRNDTDIHIVLAEIISAIDKVVASIKNE